MITTLEIPDRTTKQLNRNIGTEQGRLVDLEVLGESDFFSGHIKIAQRQTEPTGAPLNHDRGFTQNVSHAVKKKRNELANRGSITDINNRAAGLDRKARLGGTREPREEGGVLAG